MPQSLRWKTVLLWLVFLASVILVLPSLLPARVAAALPAWLVSHRLTPGLDITGGSRLVLEVSRSDLEAGRLRAAVETIGNTLRASRIAFSDLNGFENTVEVTIGDAGRVGEARDALAGTGLGSLSEEADGRFVLKLAPSTGETAGRETLLLSADVVRRRVESLGIPEASIAVIGERIAVYMPGEADPQRAKDLLAQSGQLSARLVDESVPLNVAIENGAPDGTEILYSSDEPPVGYLLRRDSLFTAADVASAEPLAGGQPRVGFRLSPESAERLRAFTRDNIGRTIAIVLDDQVISAAVIRGENATGGGELSGDFDSAGAANLARIITSGALPTPLTIIEERSLEPALGVASGRSVLVALGIAVIAVVAFIVGFYGFMGAIAALALFFNTLLVFAILTLIGTPLTLSVIAGVVLAVGISVDANVLIFERIREEKKAGRPFAEAVEAGFGRARLTVLDAFATMLITVAVLFFFAAAPVREFAVAIAAGLVATLLTTFIFTRHLVLAWLARKRLTHLPKGVRTGLFDRLNMRFMAARNVLFVFTAALSLAIAGLLMAGKLPLGIDFTGGAAIELRAKSGRADLNGIAARLTDANIEVVSIERHKGAAGALVRISAQENGDNAEQTAVLIARGELEDDYDFQSVEVVGPAISGELIHAATLGLLAGLVALVIYIWVRFEWHFAIGAIIALAHDVFFTLGFLAVARLEFDISAVAALLTIAGYSLNDTIVVYDRIRENLRQYRQMPLPILIDDAINRTLSRTVLTSATTLIALAALAIFGGDAIRTFALTLLFGVAVGTISSIYIAGPILILFRLRPERYRPGRGGTTGGTPEASGTHG